MVMGTMALQMINDDSLANRYRPRRLRDVVGQRDVVEVLMAQNRRLAAGDKNASQTVKLFSGPSGCGKTTIARALAAFELCENPDLEVGDACGECEACLTITDGRLQHPGVTEADASSNTSRKEDVEAFVRRFDYMPMHGEVQVFILDEAHGLSRQAADALLKPLENLAPHNRVYLLTTEPDSMPAAIRGRAEHFQLRLPSVQERVDLLLRIATSEGWELSREAAERVVELSPESEGVRRAVTNLSKLSSLLAERPVTPDDVTRVLGGVNAEVAAKVLDAALAGSPKKTVAAITEARLVVPAREFYTEVSRQLRDRWYAAVRSGADPMPLQRALAKVTDALSGEDFLDLRGELALVGLAQAAAPPAAPAQSVSAATPAPRPVMVEDEPVSPPAVDPTPAASTAEGEDVTERVIKSLEEMTPRPVIAVAIAKEATVTVSANTTTVTVPPYLLARAKDPKQAQAFVKAAIAAGLPGKVEFA